jgi:ubiquinone/menaquinone biosynthesis C-methylase UbiE
MPGSPEETSNKRTLSEKYHQSGKWQTKISSTRSPLIRFLWNYCSYKRKGVNILASRHVKPGFALDLGAGNGAYSHWFLGKCPISKIIALDWSFTALKNIINPRQKGKIFKICADLHYLPFKQEIFKTIFSIDTLGHVSNVEKALNEILRISTKGSTIFLHSECKDYQSRWPDKQLIHENKKDILAEHDGHFFLKTSTSLYTMYSQRFQVKSFFNPAGLLGWILGYPEKYCLAFKKARLYFLTCVTFIFAIIKKIPVFNGILRLINATTNHLELFFGLTGGGSCFAFLEKLDPAKTDSNNSS